MVNDILFCETDMEGYTLNYPKNARMGYQLDGLITLGVDLLGLQSWDEYKDIIDWNKYKLIWIHLNPRVMNPIWYTYPRLIRNKAPNAILVGSHEFVPSLFKGHPPFIITENFYREIPTEIKKNMEFLDYWSVTNKPSYEFLEKKMNIPVLYAHIGRPHFGKLEWHAPLPWEEREGIACITHSVRLPLGRKLQIAKWMNDIPVTIFSSDPIVDNADDLRQVAHMYSDNITVYNRLPWMEYLDKLRRHKLAYEIDYVGINRFAYECAKLEIPVVGTSMAEYRNMLYPEITYDNHMTLAVALNHMYRHAGEPKSLNMYANMLIEEYFTEKAVLERTKKLLEKVRYYD